MRNPRNEPLVENDMVPFRAREGSERRCVLTARIAGRDAFVRLAV
jgi:hypothetical protein